MLMKQRKWLLIQLIALAFMIIFLFILVMNLFFYSN